MILQLNPTIPVATPKGPGIAHFIIDYGIEHDILWVIFLDNGECWTYPNTQIRAEQNISAGRFTKPTFPEHSSSKNEVK